MTDYLLQGRYVDSSGRVEDTTGAKRDITGAWASSEGDWWPLTTVARSDMGGGKARILLVRTHPDQPAAILADPVSWTILWNFPERNRAVVAAEPPPGFVALGASFIETDGSRNLREFDRVAPWPGIKCVAKECVVKAGIGASIWNDHGTGARDDVSLWRIDGTGDGSGWFSVVGARSYGQPDCDAWRLDMSSVEIVLSLQEARSRLFRKRAQGSADVL